MYRKVIVSGDIIEIYEYEKEPFLGDKSGDKEKGKEIVLKDVEGAANDFYDDFERECRGEERRRQTARDTRNRVRRLALMNFGENSKFYTLTFKRNEKDINAANAVFRKFIQKLRKHAPGGLKYIAVIEFQERGAVHYHVISNTEYVPHRKLLKYWKDSGSDGSVNVRNIKSVDNVGAYLIKYMTKNAGDERLKGKKMYLCSKGLEKSREYKGYSAKLVMKEYTEGKKTVFTNSYESEYLGQITYTEYNLKR